MLYRPDRLPRGLARYVAEEAPFPLADQPPQPAPAPPPVPAAPRTELVLHAGPDCLTPGWLELAFQGLVAEQLFHPKLRITYLDGEEDGVEYTLPSQRRGRLRVVLHAQRPVTQVKLVPSHASQVFEIAAFQIRRLGRIGVLRRSLQRAPAPTLVACFWRLMGKKLRARNRIHRILSLPVSVDYGAWLRMHEPRWATELIYLRAHLRTAREVPRIGVLIDIEEGAPLSDETLRSVRGAGPDLELAAVACGELPETKTCKIVAAPGGASFGTRLQAGLEAMEAHWVLVLRNGDRLASGAVARIADTAMLRPGAEIIYGDHDLVSSSGRRHSPAFKPAWNLPLFLAHDYIGNVAVRRIQALESGALQSASAGKELGDLLLCVAAKGDGGIVHIPRILYHRPDHCEANPRTGAVEARRRMVEVHLAQTGEKATAERDGLGHVRIVRALPKPEPLVSLIVPTRDRVDLLRACVEGLQGTDYPSMEILIADNGSRKEETRRYFASLAEDLRVRILPLPGPFNFAAINNRAAQAARGSMIGFINSDIEIIEPGWLAEMISHAARPEIGAVGALLLYAEGTVQHAGVVVGLSGLAGHAHRFFSPDHLGYMRRLQSPQYLAAVTAACLVVEKRKFNEVGGFDEVGLPVAFNDVDLCLKLHAAGYRNFYTPYAKLLHKESASRVRDLSPARRLAYERECATLKERWRHVLAADPHYSPNLTQTSEDFALL